jgi:chorismate-pyruvate lyase
LECRGGASVNIRDLGLVPRILFATDGTINHILEAYAGEPVDLVRLTSTIVQDTSRWQDLGADEGERALERLSLMRGQTSDRVFVHAESVVLLDRLPEAVAEELVTEGTGLLMLLTKRRIGTFRETVSDWQGHDDEIAACFGIPASEVLVARTYEIVIGGRPVAWATETFPKDCFSLPSDGLGADGSLDLRHPGPVT